jgi:TonB-linked SusC/RagA family outer membrane protein
MEEKRLKRGKFCMNKKYKILALLLMAICTVFGAEADNQLITIQKREISVIDALDMIKQQAKVSVMYQDNIVNKRILLNLNLKNVSLSEALKAVCEPAGLEFLFKDNYVLIRNSQKTKNQTKGDTSTNGAATDRRQRSISGRTMDESGEPLPGASIRVVESQSGAISDNDGFFKIDVPANENLTLEVSFIAMVKQKIGIKTGTTDIQLKNIVLKMDDTSVGELVVTGYQQIDRRNLTSSVSSVKMKDIMLAGVTTLDKMLQGRIPDMIVTNNSGEINSVPKIRIRGTSTLIGNREPLWVVDGVIINDPVNLSADILNDPDYVNRIGNSITGLNPQDIERIDVLKDAAATALYGTRAANGIIVVTTKKGRIGKPLVAYSFTSSYRRRPRYSDSKINLMNSKERVGISRDLVNNHYQYPASMTVVGYEDAVDKFYNGTYTEDEFNAQVAKLETQNTDWFKLLTHDSFSSDHSINVSGGTENLRYYTSLGYTINNDVINNNDNKRYTGTTKLDISLSNRLKTSLNLNVYNDKKDYNPSSLSPINYAYNTSRVIPAYNDDGSYYYYHKSTSSSQSMNFNILNEINNSYVKQKISGMAATLNIRYELADWLNINGILSYSNSNTNIESYWGEKTWYAAILRQSEYGTLAPNNSLMPLGGELSEDIISSDNYTARVQANINKYFGRDKQHNINIAIGTEANSTKYNGYSETNRGFYMDRGKKFVTSIPANYTSYLSWLATNVPNIVDNKSNLLSAYATASYSYKELYTVNANTRYDGSNKFGSRSNEKLLPVWSVSGLLNIKDAAGIQSPFLNSLTWKISYGEQGNMIDNQTPVLTLKKGALSGYYNEMVSTVNTFANPDLKWEKTHSFNTGLETGLFNNRLMLSVECYYKKTTDAFMNKPISDINGYTSYVVNSGNLINKGYNVSMTAVPVRTKDLNWIVSGSLSKIINSMETVPGSEVYELGNFLNGTAVVKGQAIGTFYSYKFVGLNPADGGPLFDDWEDRATELIGLNKYDTFTKVLVPTGKRDPDISGSMNTTFSYKSWRLTAFLNYSLGANIRLFKLFSQTVGGETSGEIYPEYNLNKELLNRWKKPGDEQYTNIPSIMGGSTPGYYNYNRHFSAGTYYKGIKLAEDSWTMYDYSDIRVVSADYIQLANISLTYEIPNKILSNYKMHRVAITLSGSNLYTFCDKALKGQAPTQSGFATVQLTDRPSYTLGINVEF